MSIKTYFQDIEGYQYQIAGIKKLEKNIAGYKSFPESFMAIMEDGKKICLTYEVYSKLKQHIQETTYMNNNISEEKYTPKVDFGTNKRHSSAVDAETSKNESDEEFNNIMNDKTGLFSIATNSMVEPTALENSHSILFPNSNPFNLKNS